jgi:tetratricopeptide (TPR) repeat protein
MKTIIDRRFLIGLLICALLLAAAVEGLHAVQIGRQSRFLLEEAHRALKEKQTETAVNRFQQYLKLAPDDVDTQAEFGLLLADRNSLRDAMFMLEKVLRFQPQRDDVRRRLAAVEMQIDRWSDAKTHLELLTKKLPNDATLFDQLGTCQAAGGEYAPAAKSLQEAIKLDSHQVATYSHLAEICLQLKHAPEADDCMRKLVDKNPKSALAHILDGRYLAGTGDVKGARDQAEKALELDPKDPNALLLAARLAVEQGSRVRGQGTEAGSEGRGARGEGYEKARGFAQRLVEAAPNSAAGYIMLARIEALAGERKKAIECLETGAEKTQSRDPSLLCELGRLRIEAGDLKGGQEIIVTLGKFPSDDRLEPLIGYLAAQIELANGRWQAAIDRLEEAAPGLTHSADLLKQVRMEIAACYEKLGNTNLQLAAYRQAESLDPQWAPARLGVASTLLALGKTDEALEEFRYLSKLEGMAEAGAAGEAKSLILKNLARRPADRDWTEVDGLLSQLAKNSPDSIGVKLLQAESLSGQKRTAEAESLLLDARKKSPDRFELWTALAGLYNQQQQWPKAEQLLDDAQHKFGDQVWLRLARGSYLLARAGGELGAKSGEQKAGSGELGAGSTGKGAAGKERAAMVAALKGLGDKTEAFSPTDRMALARGLATLSVEGGDTAQAIAFARVACDADPKNLPARLSLFDLAFKNGDAAGAERALKEIRGLEGEGPFWNYGQAAICLLKPQSAALDDAAFQHLDAARKLRPGWSALPLLTAQIQDRQGQGGPALQNYLEAIDLGDLSPTGVRRTIELLYARQRYPEADRLLRRLEQQPTLFTGEVERMASKVSARLDDIDRALDLAGKVAANSHEWQDHVWLGQLQSLMGLQARQSDKKKDADDWFSKAKESLKFGIQLKPEAPEPWVALIRFYVAIDDKPKAEDAIRDAKTKVKGDSALVALAACYEAVGDVQKASKQFELALSRSPDDPVVLRQEAEFEMRNGKLADAEAHLRRILAGKASPKPDELALARRMLAAILRSSGSYPKIQQALALIEENLAAGSAPADLREKAFALADCPQPERRREAIDMLEKLSLTQPAADDLRIALAQLYLGENDWSKASSLLHTLVSTHERDPRYLSLFVLQLLKHREFDEANIWMQRLEKAAPNEFPTASLKAAVLVEHGDVDAAIKTLGDSLARPKLSKAEVTAQTRATATRFEELARDLSGPNQSAAPKLLAESERLYRQFVKDQPEQQLVLATFLARRGRFDEAIAVAAAAQPTADPNALASACAELIEKLPGSAALDQRLEKVLRAAIVQHGDATMLLVALAGLRIRQERFDDAEIVFREALEKDPANFVAMNNLATLLSLEKKHIDEAQRLVARAIAIAGPLPALLDSRATVYLALGKPTKALTDLEKAIAVEPKPNRQFHRALAYFQLGQVETAAQALGEARKLGFKPEQLGVLERGDYQQLAAKLER